MDERRLDSLLENAKRREPEALAELCAEIYPKLLKYMHYRVAPAVAEDLTGEVLIRVLRSTASQKGNFIAWLYKIAANVVTDHLRRRKVRREVPIDVHTAATVASGDDPAGIVGRQMDLQNAIARLTDDQRELVTLKFVQGLSTAEAAEITGRTREAIRALQFRALHALRKILKGEGYQP